MRYLRSFNLSSIFLQHRPPQGADCRMHDAKFAEKVQDGNNTRRQPPLLHVTCDMSDGCLIVADQL